MKVYSCIIYLYLFMNQVTEEKKESLTKTLAIVGFIAVVIFSVWLAVQIVRVVPSAFSSLASIADVVYNYNNKQELQVTTTNSVVNANESFTISWTDMRKEGTYVFSYECTDGVSVEIRLQGVIKTVACDTEIDLSDINTLEIRVASEKFRFVDMPYTIAFKEKGTEDMLLKRSTITMVNASIPTTGVAQEEAETPVVVPNTETAPSTPTPSKPTTPTYTAGKPVTTTKYVYTTPVSDPKGKVDLQVTFIAVGELNGKVFTPKTSVDTDENGALQFEVKNVGTKTAEDWEYEATLPGDISYSSPDQKALKPNERAVITLGFSGLSESGKETVGAEVTAKGDVKTSNNEFTKSVTVVD
jgi:hypothetical protein